ncbi:MAG: hypothetical protein NT066_00385 [Candidatus Omnitrophica bacterium]|nr:hypothetical protein [Candidatus Omnitrophota bacterium]
MPNSDSHNKSLFFVSQTGCLLPFLILFNLLFGWMFFKLLTWLLIEGTLVLLFILNARIMMKKIFSSSSSKRDNVIDVEGEVVEEKKKLK